MQEKLWNFPMEINKFTLTYGQASAENNVI